MKILHSNGKTFHFLIQNHKLKKEALNFIKIILIVAMPRHPECAVNYRFYEHLIN